MQENLTKWILALGFICLSSYSVQPIAAQQKKLILVVGAPGEASFQESFSKWANSWYDAAAAAQLDTTTIGWAPTSQDVAAEQTDPSSSEATSEPVESKSRTDLEKLQAALTSEPAAEGEELWLVLIGHGTYDGKSAKFNLQGPDISAEALGQLLNARRTKDAQQIVINCASASSPFINKLSDPSRIVVTATQHEAQYNFARFGGFLAETVGSDGVDLDKDQQISLLELILAASKQTQKYYAEEDRLATELALIDDNGDGAGTPTDWFQGIRVVRQAKDHPADGLRANQVFFRENKAADVLSNSLRQKRDALERQLADLRARKPQMEEAIYLAQLEKLAIQIARLYEQKP